MKFTEIVRRLRGVCPPTGKVSVRRVKMADEGRCSLARGKFVVEVSTYDGWTRDELIEALQAHVLLHEWAHALSWHSIHGRSPHHCGHWGVSMSEVFDAAYPSVE